MELAEGGAAGEEVVVAASEEAEVCVCGWASRVLVPMWTVLICIGGRGGRGGGAPPSKKGSIQAYQGQKIMFDD